MGRNGEKMGRNGLVQDIGKSVQGGLLPQVPYFVFVIEVTQLAMRMNLVLQIVQSVKSLLPYFPGHR